MKFLLSLMMAALSGMAVASCPEQPFSRPVDKGLITPSALLVTHASRVFDPLYASKRGIDRATRIGKSNHIPVIFLQNDDVPESYFADDCHPDLRLHSEYGELGMVIDASEIFLAGGHLEQCLNTTIRDILTAWTLHPKHDLALSYLMDAIYSNGDLVQEGDPYKKNFELVRNALQFPSDHENAPEPKITLLTAMNLIEGREEKFSYLTRLLSGYKFLLPESTRIVIEYAGQQKIIGDTRTKPMRTLAFRFLETMPE